jgi:hypothetical protein
VARQAAPAEVGPEAEARERSQRRLAAAERAEQALQRRAAELDDLEEQLRRETDEREQELARRDLDLRRERDLRCGHGVACDRTSDAPALDAAGR